MRPNTLRLLRRYHNYLGLFFAPMIVLFALSGALQTFRLQEANGYGGPPPGWIIWLASVHKDQGPPREPKLQKPRSPAATPDALHNRSNEQPSSTKARPSPLPLKIFVVLLALALTVSTLMGVTIALANKSARTTSIFLLVLGTIVPIGLLWI